MITNKTTKRLPLKYLHSWSTRKSEIDLGNFVCLAVKEALSKFSMLQKDQSDRGQGWRRQVIHS